MYLFFAEKEMVKLINWVPCWPGRLPVAKRKHVYVGAGISIYRGRRAVNILMRKSKKAIAWSTLSCHRGAFEVKPTSSKLLLCSAFL